MRRFGLVAIFAVSLAVFAAPLGAQSTTTTTTTAPVWDPAEFPQWAHDVRRGEIVLFGAFPFAWFVSTFCLDLYRTAQHDGDNRYYPWPAKPAGAVEMNNEEWGTALLLTAGISVGVMIADQIIIHAKRAKAKKAAARHEGATPIIIKRKAQTPQTPPPTMPTTPQALPSAETSAETEETAASEGTP